MPNPCSPPSISSPYVLGGCNVGSIASGSSCTLGCVSGYLVSGSLPVNCSFGALTSQTGQCSYDVSAVALLQPDARAPAHGRVVPRLGHRGLLLPARLRLRIRALAGEQLYRLLPQPDVRVQRLGGLPREPLRATDGAGRGAVPGHVRDDDGVGGLVLARLLARLHPLGLARADLLDGVVVHPDGHLRAKLVLPAYPLRLVGQDCRRLCGV